MCKWKKSKFKYTSHPFLYGIYTGALNRVPFIFSGGVRTFQNLGLCGESSYNQVVFQNRLTYIGFRYAIPFVFHHPINPQALIPIWQNLPTEARTDTKNWGRHKAGQIIGGTIISSVISRQLIKVMPKTLVFPIMFILTCQGYMSTFWGNNNDRKPPPSSGGLGGGPSNHSILV